ncbi:MAG TPA: creatininase family protein [Gemmatimonadales bacterium]
MTPRPFVLAETTWPAASGAGFDVAVLPWGATEAHNRHLPYATDALETERIAVASADIAWARGAKVVVLPTVPFGVHTAQPDIPFCLNVNPTTQLALLRDLTSSLAPHGVRKLVILNGHGANEFRWMIRELQPRVPLFLCTVNWYAVLDPKAYFTDPGDHGGELETSVTMHLAPELVRPLSEAGPGRARAWRIAALREGWAWAPRQWSKVTDDTGVGNPAGATAAKGARYVKDVTAKIAGFLVELAAADPGDLYA